MVLNTPLVVQFVVKGFVWGSQIYYSHFFSHFFFFIIYQSSLCLKDVVPKAMIFTNYSPMVLFSDEAKLVEFEKKSDSDDKLLSSCDPGHALFKVSSAI